VPLYKAAFDAQTWWMQCSSSQDWAFGCHCQSI
jgi:hypothetical protein